MPASKSVLRHRLVLTGEEHEALRITWTLSRDDKRCALEEVIETAPSVAANGEDDAPWSVDTRRSWTGPLRSGGECDLSGSDGRLRLKCARAHVPVHPSYTTVRETGRCEPSYFDSEPECEDAEQCTADGNLGQIRHPLVFSEEMIERIVHETTCGYGGGGGLRRATRHDS